MNYPTRERVVVVYLKLSRVCAVVLCLLRMVLRCWSTWFGGYQGMSRL